MQNPQSNMEGTVENTKCLKGLVAESAEQSKVGEFHKKADAKLEELAKAADKEEETYRAKRDEMENKWKEQDSRISELGELLHKCNPHWEKDINDAVCTNVIHKIWDLKYEIESRLGYPELILDWVNSEFDQAGRQLDAWKTITNWIQAQQSVNEKWIEEICKLDNCKDRQERLFSLYILHFELLPSHQKLINPNPAHEFTDPEAHYCGECRNRYMEISKRKDDGQQRFDYIIHAETSKSKSPKVSGSNLRGYPWLIEADKYNCEVADVWEVWRDIGISQAYAQSDYDLIIKLREQYAATSTAEAKRNAAREELKKLGIKSSNEMSGSTAAVKKVSSSPKPSEPPPSQPPKA